VQLEGERVPLLPLLAQWLDDLPDGRAASAHLAGMEDEAPVLIALA
jgi:hypothetical protein